MYFPNISLSYTLVCQISKQVFLNLTSYIVIKTNRDGEGHTQYRPDVTYYAIAKMILRR